jgi:hypothetical protein
MGISMRGRGFLIIWSDIDLRLETDYIHWLTREHTAERVSTDGFIAVRVFRALMANARRYLINYELESAAVVNAPAYVAKLNNPTPWTRRTLPRLKNFVRGGGQVTHAAGMGQGGFVTALALAGPIPIEIGEAVKALAQCDRIAAVRMYQTDQSRTAVGSKEKELRIATPGADDRSFSGVLFIEGTDEDALRAATARLARSHPQIGRNSTMEALIYASVFTLERRTLENDHEA